MKIETLINSPLTKSIKIVSKKSFFTNKKTYYAVNKNGNKLAQFEFTPAGEIDGLSLKKTIQTKKRRYVCIICD